MGIFKIFKKKSGETDVPQWASFFDANEYAAFLKELDNYLKRKNVKYEYADGVLIVKENEFGLNNLGLTNVMQVCKQAGITHYSDVITEHFNSLIRAKNFDKEFEKIADNFEEVKKYIGVRLYDQNYVAHVGKELTIGYDFAGDIYAMVVFDFPDSIVSIEPQQTRNWNKANKELFELGIKNIREKYPLSISREQFGDFSAWFVQSDHFYTPNIVFDIDNKAELIGSKGSLIAVPHRHAAIIYPIENLEVVKVVNILLPAVYGMYREGPGSLSNNLFWYKDGTFTQLPYKIEENKIQFFPPGNFVEVINTLK